MKTVLTFVQKEVGKFNVTSLSIVIGLFVLLALTYLYSEIIISLFGYGDKAWLIGSLILFVVILLATKND